MTRGAVAIGVSCAAAGSGCAAATGKEAAAAAAARVVEDADDGERGREASLTVRHGGTGSPTVSLGSPSDAPLSSGPAPRADL